MPEMAGFSHIIRGVLVVRSSFGAGTELRVLDSVSVYGAPLLGGPV